MAVYFRSEKDNNDSVSFVMEDTDGSGDLNRILGKLANKHRISEGEEPISFFYRFLIRCHNMILSC